MQGTQRCSGFARGVAAMAVMLTALGGCVAAPLLQLATAPAPQATPCAPVIPGGATPGCDGGATGSIIPGMTSVMRMLAAGAPLSH